MSERREVMKALEQLKPGLVPEAPASIGAVWIHLSTAALLVDSNAEALRKRVKDLPPGVVRKWGRSVLIHRERFLAWLESSNTAR